MFCVNKIGRLHGSVEEMSNVVTDALSPCVISFYQVNSGHNCRRGPCTQRLSAWNQRNIWAGVPEP